MKIRITTFSGELTCSFLQALFVLYVCHFWSLVGHGKWTVTYLYVKWYFEEMEGGGDDVLRFAGFRPTMK